VVSIIKKDTKNIQIGMDIGSHSIKAVAILHTKQRPRLVNFAIKPVENNIIRAITEAHAELGIPKVRVVASVSGPTVIVRYVEIPSMTEDELQGATRFEAEKVIPYNINEVELDSAKIEDLDGKRMRVVMVAVKKDLIDSQIKILQEAGLEPAVIDIDSFAIANAFLNTGIGNSSVCGLINIGFNKTNLHIVKSGKSYFSRDIDIGGYQIVQLIADSMSLPEKQAIKIMQNCLSGADDTSADEKKIVAGFLHDTLLRLVDEVRLSFDFYENSYTHSVDNIYISGGITIYDIVTNFLKEHLGKETLVWSPFENIDTPEGFLSEESKGLVSQFAVAVGLGLRRVD
jgi:type IV pilus assembly protein PilM